MIRSVMSLSGGMDSTSLLLRLLAEGSKVTCLTYDYGQKHSIEIDRSNNRAKIKDINMVKKHIKTTKEKKGGIISKENFINISNLVNFEKKNDKKEVKK